MGPLGYLIGYNRARCQWTGRLEFFFTGYARRRLLKAPVDVGSIPTASTVAPSGAISA